MPLRTKYFDADFPTRDQQRQCLTRLPSNLFIRPGMLKKKKVPRNPKGAPAVYLILLCGAIRRTGAERATEWRKWRIHYLAKGANSRAEMDPPWAFFSYSSSSFGAVNIKQWRRRGMRGRDLKGGGHARSLGKMLSAAQNWMDRSPL